MKKIFNHIFWSSILIALIIILIKIVLGWLYNSETSKASLGNLQVNLKYGKVSAYDRPVFGYKIPYDIVWRTGAEDATEISFSEDCYFGGKKIKKGKYSLWTIPSKKNWLFLLNTQTGIKGTEYNELYDILKVKAVAEILNSNHNDLEIKLVNLNNQKILLSIFWEKTKVSVPITL